MVLRFYLFGMVSYSCSFLVERVTRRKKLPYNNITLVVLLHFLCGALWAGPVSFLIGAAGVLAFVIYELGTHYPVRYTIPILGLSMGVLYWLVRAPNIVLPLIPAFLLLAVITCFGTQPMLQHGIFFSGFSTCFLTVGAASLIALYNTRAENIIILMLLLHLNDVFGYAFGRRFGRHKLFKTLSPGKSLEGYLGSLVGLLEGMLVLHTLVPALQGQTLIQDVILLSFIYVCGNLGDLLFSRIKRQLKIKDFSNALPGHGGFLDRTDNVFFTAPLFYVLIAYNIV